MVCDLSFLKLVEMEIRELLFVLDFDGDKYLL